MTNYKKILKEYSEKTITSTIERWKKDNPKVDDTLAKQIIQRFDQIKDSLSRKLDIVSLSDELKKNNNYLNIDKYSFDDMVKLIRSLPENPEKIKKEAIDKFVKKEGINIVAARSYVARFMNKRDALKHATENGLEDFGFTKEDVLGYIPRFLTVNDSYLDPRNWRWEQFEQMLDALFPSHKAVGEENTAETDADKVYDKDGIEIYKGDDVNKCISYNPVVNGRKKYGWCVTQVGNVNYDGYRFGDLSPTFYFVFDRNKTSEPDHAPFKDEWHAFVVQVNSDNSSYIVTGGNNRGDNRVSSWEKIQDVVPADTWSRIKNLKDYFKSVPLSPVERGRKFASGKNLTLDEFKELTQDEKILYIQGKASKGQLTDDILAILPKYKISLEGRSTTLANVAIDSGQRFPYSTLKDNEPLAKRYAIFRFRHTNYGKEPIPLPYIKYLDEDAKEKYLKTFDGNLTFEYIIKYFGEQQAKNYIEEQAKKLEFIPPDALKYISDEKLKKLYEIYSKLFKNWVYNKNTNINEEELEKLQSMPEQEIQPVPITAKQWVTLSPSDKNVVLKLAEKITDSNYEKYSTLAYAVPFFLKDKEKYYALLPLSTEYPFEKWVLMDENNKVVKDKIDGFSSSLNNQDLQYGYPNFEENPKRIYSIKDLKV